MNRSNLGILVIKFSRIPSRSQDFPSLLVVFVLILSIVGFHGIALGDPVQSNGTTPLTQWVPAGPASDTIRYSIFASDAAELASMCVGQAPSCIPSLDLSDVPVSGNDLSPASGCIPSPTHVCALNDPRFWVTAPTLQLGELELDFNHASTFWGITFCNGQDNVIAGQLVCPDGPGAGLIAATCPNAPGSDCTTAAIHVRQGIASLIDKQAFTIANLGAIGPGAVPMDNPMTPASSILHSGYDLGNSNPCNGGFPCTPGLANCGGTGCNPVGPYSVVVSTPVGPLRVVAPGTGTYNLGGVCSWDLIAGCATIPISAFHYANDATDSAGFVLPGSVDFCRAADHFIAAGLATGKNSMCELIGESAPLANGNILFYGQVSQGRQLLSRGYSSAICELVSLGSTTCPQVTLNAISQAQAHQIILTGCKTATEPGCRSFGPITAWNIYAGGHMFSTPTPDSQWTIYDSALASDLCGGGSPGQNSPNYDFVCNRRHDTWVRQSHFQTSPAAATAALQVAMDLFGNHTFTIPIWTPSIQYPYVKGWTGVSNAPGIGTAQGNKWSLLNMWNPNPAIAGPTIRWGQSDATISLNVFSYNSAVEADLVNEVYDTLLVTNPFSPTQIIGWMANSYEKLSPGTTECPASYMNSRGTFSVGACIKIGIRGDIPFQDIYNCAATDAVCLGSHTVTASDVKFSFASFNATGGIITPSTLNTIDVVYNLATLPTTLGGAQVAGATETFFIYLHNDNVWALNDIAGVPIIPQRLWINQTTSPKLANGVLAPCTDLGTASCTVDPAFTAGTQSDPILANKLVGSGPFVCSSGPLGVSGTVIGGGCTFDSTSAPTGQAIPIGGTATLRRFVNDQGTSPTSLDPNFAYFRTNAKYLQFQWAAFKTGVAATAADLLSAQHACDPLTNAVGGRMDYATCQHWATPDSGLACNPTAGACTGIQGGGGGTRNALIQINQWIVKGAWCFGVTSCNAVAGVQTRLQTLYEDGSTEGSFGISSSTTTMVANPGSPGTATVSVFLSGGPDNNFTGTVPVTLSTVQSCGIEGGCDGVKVTPSLTGFTLTPGVPTTSTTLALDPATAGGYTVIVIASSPNFPNATVTIHICEIQGLCSEIPNPGPSVGGLLNPVDNLALATPYIALLVAVILPASVIIVRHARRKNRMMGLNP